MNGLGNEIIEKFKELDKRKNNRWIAIIGALLGEMVLCGFLQLYCDWLSLQLLVLSKLTSK